jgi:hypothetical protein
MSPWRDQGPPDLSVTALQWFFVGYSAFLFKDFESYSLNIGLRGGGNIAAYRVSSLQLNKLWQTWHSGQCQEVVFWLSQSQFYCCDLQRNSSAFSIVILPTNHGESRTGWCKCWRSKYSCWLVNCNRWTRYKTSFLGVSQLTNSCSGISWEYIRTFRFVLVGELCYL